MPMIEKGWIKIVTMAHVVTNYILVSLIPYMLILKSNFVCSNYKNKLDKKKKKDRISEKLTNVLYTKTKGKKRD